MSEAYIDYAQKGDVLFNAQREIALQGQNYEVIYREKARFWGFVDEKKGVD